MGLTSLIVSLCWSSLGVADADCIPFLREREFGGDARSFARFALDVLHIGDELDDLLQELLRVVTRDTSVKHDGTAD